MTLLKKPADVAELLDEEIHRRGSASLLFCCLLNLPRFVEADVDERAGKDGGELVRPIGEQLHHARIARIELSAMGKVGERGVLLDAKEVVQMPIELQAWNHIDVPLARVRDDVLNLLAGEAGLRIQQRIAGELDVRFVVEVVLIRLPAGEKVDLPLDLLLGRKRSLTHIDHGSAIGRGRPVFDPDRRDRRDRAAFHQLTERFDTIEDTSGGLRLDDSAAGSHLNRVGFARMRTGNFSRLGQCIDGAGSAQTDDRSG